MESEASSHRESVNPIHPLTEYSSDSRSTSATYCLGRRTAYRMRWESKIIKVGRIAAIHGPRSQRRKKLYPAEEWGTVRLGNMLPKCNNSTLGSNDYDGWLTMQVQGH